MKSKNLREVPSIFKEVHALGDAAAAEDCEEDGEASGDGDIAGILAPKKCKNTGT